MSKFNIPKKFLIFGSIIILFSVLIFVSVILGSKTTKKPVTKTELTDNSDNLNQSPNGSAIDSQTQYTYNPPDKIIAKVGEENIYQKDLDTELENFPTHDEAAQKLLLNKLVEDSKIIQNAKKENLIPVDNTVYNSPEKDYTGRINIIQQIKTELLKKTVGLKGSIISVWFLNDHVGPLGYEPSKALALKKITDLHTGIKSGTLTMEQAAENIRNDTSLTQLDTNYRNNAIYYFNVTPDKKITWESEFDKILWELRSGEVSDVFTAGSPDFDNNNQVVPAYFMFGQVTNKLEEVQNPQEETNYEVKYF